MDDAAFGEETRQVVNQFAYIFRKDPPPRWALINTTWIDKNKRWLDVYAALVTALMLDLGIYTVRKSDPQNIAKYDQICNTLMRYVDLTDWNHETHTAALKDRLQTKMGLIKKQLIREGRIAPNGAGAYVKTNRSAAGPSSTPSRTQVDQLMEDPSLESRSSSAAASGEALPAMEMQRATSTFDFRMSHVAPELEKTPEVESTIERVRRAVKGLELAELSDILVIILDRLDGTETFWGLIVERFGFEGAADTEDRLIEGADREDVNLRMMVTMRKLADSRLHWYQKGEPSQSPAQRPSDAAEHRPQ